MKLPHWLATCILRYVLYNPNESRKIHQLDVGLFFLCLFSIWRNLLIFLRRKYRPEYWEPLEFEIQRHKDNVGCTNISMPKLLNVLWIESQLRFFWKLIAYPSKWARMYTYDEECALSKQIHGNDAFLFVFIHTCKTAEQA